MSQPATDSEPQTPAGTAPPQAILQVQEGIVIDASPGWIERFGGELPGQPVMDLFDEASRPALKGALAACLQGRWSGHSLKLGALLGDGTVNSIEVMLERCDAAQQGQPCIQLSVPDKPRGERRSIEALEHAVLHDRTTDLLHRRELIEALRERLGVPIQGGVRCLALIKLERFAAIERSVGATASEQVLAGFAGLLKETLHPTELAGRFGGVRFLVWLQRGNEKDLLAWARQLVAESGKHTQHINGKAVVVSCAVGLALVPAAAKNIDTEIAAAVEVCAKGAQRGDSQVLTSWGADGRVVAQDEVWIKRIKNALLENRFRLVKQPVASLRGGDPRMFDVLLRMVDAQDKEVLPGEFLPAAERNDLLKNIDRWVVSTSLTLAAQQRPACLFVRLSKDTVQDPSFLPWLDGHIRSARADPQRVCFQVTEGPAPDPQVRMLAEKLRQWGFRFALEGFGASAGSRAQLESMPLDFVKIDGSLVQVLARDQERQQQVRALTEVAAKHGVRTIAERVEDANTMAVLWQLGVEYIQGYFVNAPEDVVLTADSGTARLRSLSDTAQVRSLGDTRSR